MITLWNDYRLFLKVASKRNLFLSCFEDRRTVSEHYEGLFCKGSFFLQENGSLKGHLIFSLSSCSTNL